MRFYWSVENCTKTILAMTQKQEHSNLVARLSPFQRAQTRGSLNPIGPIAISSKWLSRELNRIGFQGWCSLGAFVAIDMERLSVYSSLELELSALQTNRTIFYIFKTLVDKSSCWDKFQKNVDLTYRRSQLSGSNMGHWVRPICRSAQCS
jgi:hypothetical protein